MQACENIPDGCGCACSGLSGFGIVGSAAGALCAAASASDAAAADVTDVLACCSDDSVSVSS